MKTHPLMLSVWIAAFVVFVAGCAHAARPPTIAPAQAAASEPTTPTPAIWLYPTSTDTPRSTVTPEPSPTFGHTARPRLAETIRPSPTPAVTIAPTAAPPVIPFPEGTTAEPFTVYYRDTDERISAISSAPGAEARVFLDPVARFGLYLVAKQGPLFGEWGSISPDGRTFALMLSPELAPPPEEYMSVNEPVNIYLYDVETGALRLFAEKAYHPVWSPDSTRIAYRTTGGLWVSDMQTGNAALLYTPAEFRENEPTYVPHYAWSYDGQRLLVLREYDVEFYELNVLPVEQPDEVKVIVPGMDGDYSLRFAQWSPVDDRIVFTFPLDELSVASEVCIEDPDGNEGRCRTYDLEVSDPVWSPDGSWIAFSGYPIGEPRPVHRDLWLLDPATGDVRRMTYSRTAGTSNIMPAWSPDGTQLLYSRASTAEAEAWVLSLLDGSERRLVRPAGLKAAGLVIGP